MYKLVKIKPTGIRITIIDDQDKDSLIAASIMMEKKNPEDKFGVTDSLGFFVWPEKLAQAHIEPASYDPIVPDRYGSPEQ
jgi:hypothetical protein